MIDRNRFLTDTEIDTCMIHVPNPKQYQNKLDSFTKTDTETETETETVS